MVKKVVLGYKARIGEKVKITRNGLAQVARKCVKKVTGKMVDGVEKVTGKMVDGVGKVTGKMIDSVEKVAKKIETKN